MFEVLIERRAERDLNNIPKNYQIKIIDVLKQIKNFPANLKVKKLISTQNIYRVKIDDYRIIIEVNYKEKNIFVLRIRHRNEAYKNF